MNLNKQESTTINDDNPNLHFEKKIHIKWLTNFFQAQTMEIKNQ